MSKTLTFPAPKLQPVQANFALIDRLDSDASQNERVLPQNSDSDLSLFYPSKHALGVEPEPVIPGSRDNAIELKGLHWLRSKLSSTHKDEVLNYIKERHPKLIYEVKPGHRGYSHRLVSDSGLNILYNEDPKGFDTYQETIEVEFTGNACEFFGNEFLLDFASYARGLGATFLRADFKIADWSNTFTGTKVKQFYDQSEGHSNIPGITKVGHVGTDEMIDGRVKTTLTVTVGSRHSEHCLRLYNGKKKHDEDAEHIELEAKGKRVIADMNAVLDVWERSRDLEETLRFMGSLIVGAFRFVHRTDVHVDRCEEWKPYSRLKALVGSAKIAIDRPKVALERLVKYQEKYWRDSQLSTLMARAGAKVEDIAIKGLEHVKREVKPVVMQFLSDWFDRGGLNTAQINRMATFEQLCEGGFVSIDFLRPSPT